MTAGRDYSQRTAAAARPPEETSLLGFVNILLKHRGVIASCILFATIIGVASALTEPRMYTTRVLFTARGVKSGLLAGIAQRYNFSFVGSDQGQSLEFYESLLNSPELLRAVAREQYETRTRAGVRRGTLPMFYDIHAGSRDAEIDLAADELGQHVATNTNRRTGVITFLVSSPNPDLTRELAENLATRLDVYNSSQRRAQAAAERDFIEKRVEDARVALAGAEGQLRSFRELNRQYQASPTLALENDRLDREVTRRQQLYTSLSQSYEQARIEEERDIPAINVLEPPERPVSPDITYGARNILLGAIAGLLVGIVLAFIRERATETKAAGSPVFAEFSRLIGATLQDLRKPLRLFRAKS